MNRYFVVLQEGNNYRAIDSYFSNNVINGYYKGPLPQSISYVIGPANLNIDIAKCTMNNGTLSISEDSDAKSKYIEGVKNQVRIIRNNLLLKTDWTVGFDSPLSSDDKNLMVTYRQNLRDLPSVINENNYNNVPYPIHPNISTVYFNNLFR